MDESAMLDHLNSTEQMARSPRRTTHGLLYRSQRRSDRPISPQGQSAVIDCGSDASVACSRQPLRLEFSMGRSFVPSIVPSGHDQNFYLVINNYGNFGPARSEDASEDVARETLRCLDLAGDALPS
jgi:hypothetical protein